MSNDLFHVENYKGREITVTFRPHTTDGRSTRSAGFVVHLDGRTFQNGFFPTERWSRIYDEATNTWGSEYTPVDTPHDKLIAKAAKKGRSWVDANIADDEIRPSLEQSIRYLPRSVHAHLHTYPSLDDYSVGDLVWFYSRGNFRTGRIEKIGKTNIGVAYVTEVGGVITRKSLKPTDVGFDIEEVKA